MSSEMVIEGLSEKVNEQVEWFFWLYKRLKRGFKILKKVYNVLQTIYQRRLFYVIILKKLRDLIFKINNKLRSSNLMVVNTILKVASPFIPVAGSAYGFAKTCIKIYNSTSPTQRVILGVKGIVINCTPPVVKYPLLCATALVCGAAACVTGEANFAVAAFECCTSIVEE